MKSQTRTIFHHMIVYSNIVIASHRIQYDTVVLSLRPCFDSFHRIHADAVNCASDHDHARMAQDIRDDYIQLLPQLMGQLG